MCQFPLMCDVTQSLICSRRAILTLLFSFNWETEFFRHFSFLTRFVMSRGLTLKTFPASRWVRPS